MLYWNTVQPALKDGLLVLMKSRVFSDFRLVGGTALSLYKGHRMSIDIDLFTDAEYGGVDFNGLEKFLKGHFSYVDASFGTLPGMGRSYLVGTDRQNNTKLDVFYSMDKFLYPSYLKDGLRLASVDDIVAMKMDVISRGGNAIRPWYNHFVSDALAGGRHSRYHSSGSAIRA